MNWRLTKGQWAVAILLGLVLGLLVVFTFEAALNPPPDPRHVRATEAGNRIAERLEASLDCDFVMQGYADLREEAPRLSPKEINEWKAALDRASAELCR